MQVAAMQVSDAAERLSYVAPLQISEEERALHLVHAPQKMAVRIDEEIAGRIQIRSNEGNSFEVRLGDLIDLVSSRIPRHELERFSSSDAADQFVSFDKLRSMGLGLRYNPAYDELHLSSQG